MFIIFQVTNFFIFVKYNNPDIHQHTFRNIY